MPHHERYAELSNVQKAFIESLTDEKVVQIVEAAALLRDLTADARAFLRQAKPETLKFLTEARKEEIRELENGIELVRAFKTTGRVVKWAIITAGTVLASVIAIKSWLMGKT